MYRRRGCVDAVEPAPAEHCNDRSYLVHIESTAASTTTGRSESWYHVPTTSVRDLGILR